MENFSIGNALGTGFRVWFKNLPAFMLLSIIIYSPAIIYTYTIVSQDLASLTIEQAQSWVIFSFVWGVAAHFILASTIIYGVVQELSGNHASLGTSVTKGLSRLFPVLLIALLLIIGVAIGLVLIVVPGVILYCMWYVTIPAAVLERPGIFGAFSRSAALTKGHRWEIFGIIVVMWLISYAINKALESAFVSPSLDDFKTLVIVSISIQIAFSALQASIDGCTYFLLRREKEGTGADELARVFD